MTPLDEAAPDQANWYETREGRQRTRILWSSRWQLPWWWSRQASTVIAATGWR